MNKKDNHPIELDQNKKNHEIKWKHKKLKRTKITFLLWDHQITLDYDLAKANPSSSSLIACIKPITTQMKIYSPETKIVLNNKKDINQLLISKNLKD